MTKRKTKAAPAQQNSKEEEVYFDELLEKFTKSAIAQVHELKAHQVGAHTYGSDGLFIVALEALTGAQRTRDPRGYITAAAYALAAVIHAVGAWDNPDRPQQGEGPPAGETT